MLCIEAISAPNTRCPANNAGSSRALCEWSLTRIPLAIVSPISGPISHANRVEPWMHTQSECGPNAGKRAEVTLLCLFIT